MINIWVLRHSCFFFSLSILLFLILTYWLGLCGLYWFGNLIRWLKFLNQNLCVKVLNICQNSKYVVKSRKITLCSTEKQINRDSRREINLFTSFVSLRKWSMLTKSQYRDFSALWTAWRSWMAPGQSVGDWLGSSYYIHYIRLSFWMA